MYLINGYYYLFVAQGGTTYCHQQRVARSRSLREPFETMPGMPFLTQYDAPFYPIQKSGRGSLGQTQNEEWYFVHLMSRPLHHSWESAVDPRGWCPLGRETGIQKVEWKEDGWPYIVGGHNGREYVEEPTGIQEYMLSLKARPGYLRLYGRQSLMLTFKQAPESPQILIILYIESWNEKKDVSENRSCKRYANNYNIEVYLHLEEIQNGTESEYTGSDSKFCI